MRNLDTGRRHEGLSWVFALKGRWLELLSVPLCGAQGGELFVYNEDRTHIGTFNHLNVKEWQGLALSLIEVLAP